MKRFLLLALWGMVGCRAAVAPPTFVPIPTPTAVSIAPTVAVVDTAVPPTAAPAPADPTAVPTTAADPTAVPSPTPQVAQPATAVAWEPVAAGFFKPIGLTHAGDERLFVVEQHGLISIIQNGQRLATPFLDLVDTVNSNSNEQGLLGLAFHPDYATNGRFYVNYTGGNGETTLAEYTVSSDPNVADAASGRVFLIIPQPYANHNGGQIAFGPDGYLYIGMGDGGSQDDPQNNAQNGNSLLGKILRIDVNQAPYGIPADNPFVGDDGVRDEIWAVGLRNPWRFSFDKLTGDLFVGDVGQNEWEEINWHAADSPSGTNYGWRLFEGTHCYIGDCNSANLTEPIAEYSHAGGHCSVTGGYIYRGQDAPALWGNYFFADYCSGTLWRLFPQENGAWLRAEVGRADFLIASFGEDARGELYLLSQSEGIVYRLR